MGSSLILCAGCSSSPENWLRSTSELIIGFVLLPMVVIGLLWFLYAAFLKKILRARHIRVLRERREMREVVERSRRL
jgi:hypothetical protein